MKKIILTTLIFNIIIFSAIFAQSNKFNIGIEGGTGISNTIGIFNPGIGYTGGLYYQYHSSKKISTRVGLSYEQKVSNDEITFFDTIGIKLNQVSTKQNYEFLTMPVLIRADFGSKLNYFINAGPYFSFLLKQSLQVDNHSDNSISETDYTSNFKRFETGFSIGIGLSFPILEKLSLSLEMRNNLGLSNLSKIEGATTKTNSAHLLVGLTYSLG